MKKTNSKSSKKLNEKSKTAKAGKISSSTDRSDFFAGHFEKAKAMWKKQQPFPNELLTSN